MIRCAVTACFAAWTFLLCAGGALSAEVPCCRLFGFDAAPMLGHEAAVCGKIRDADDRDAAESEAREDRRHATACALEAQSRGRAFVYTYRLLVSPDIDMVYQAVFGAHGERLLLRMGLYRGENIRTVEVCATLSVQADGQVAKQGCRLRQGTLD
jgi:hypothetical protein